MNFPRRRTVSSVYQFLHPLRIRTEALTFASERQVRLQGVPSRSLYLVSPRQEQPCKESRKVLQSTI